MPCIYIYIYFVFCQYIYIYIHISTINNSHAIKSHTMVTGKDPKKPNTTPNVFKYVHPIFFSMCSG